MFDTFELSGVRKLAVWNGNAESRAHFQSALLDRLVAFLAAADPAGGAHRNDELVTGQSHGQSQLPQLLPDICGSDPQQPVGDVAAAVNGVLSP